MNFYNSIATVLGKPPTVRLNRIANGLKADVYAKLEFFNHKKKEPLP